MKNPTTDGGDRDCWKEEFQKEEVWVHLNDQAVSNICGFRDRCNTQGGWLPDCVVFKANDLYKWLEHGVFKIYNLETIHLSI